jgi:hypothetical protein
MQEPRKTSSHIREAVSCLLPSCTPYYVLGGSFLGFVEASRYPALRDPDSQKKRATDETRIEHRFKTLAPSSVFNPWLAGFCSANLRAPHVSAR